MTDQRLTKSNRLLKQDEFVRVHNSNVFVADDVLVVTGVANNSQRTRLGLSISKRVGNAVVRNGWKRRIREAFRRQRADLPIGIDLVVRPRKGAICNYQAISQSLMTLSKRLAKKLDKQASRRS